MNIFILGSSGYLGRKVVSRLAQQEPLKFNALHLFDINQNTIDLDFGLDIEITCIKDDIRTFDFQSYFVEHNINKVIHLASIVTPASWMTETYIFDVEVGGTKRVLDACLHANVEQLILTSSGAAYGYSKRNHTPLTEDLPLEGHLNKGMIYAKHKKEIEGLLVNYKAKHTALKQLILRPCTILGEGTKNLITNMFDNAYIKGVVGTDTPFSLIYDEDLVSIIVQGLKHNKEGVYNTAADGVMTLKHIAAKLNKPFVRFPVWFLKMLISVLHFLKLSPYKPSQVDFLRYRPVLDNTKLKNEFGFISTKNAEEIFDYYLSSRATHQS